MRAGAIVSIDRLVSEILRYGMAKVRTQQRPPFRCQVTSGLDGPERGALDHRDDGVPEAFSVYGVFGVGRADAQTIARMPPRTASSNRSHASMTAARSGSLSAPAISGSPSPPLQGMVSRQSNSRLPLSAILLHMLATSAQCGYNAIDAED